MGAVVDIAKAVTVGLVPPRDMEDSQAIYRYFLVVSGAIIGGFVMGAFHVAWACGFLASFGLQGFAMAEDVATNRSNIASIQVLLTKKAISDQRVIQCKAYNEGNQAALTLATQQLEELRDAYGTLAKKDARVPSCEELLVPVKPRQPT